jgi:hypothetical protein
MGNTCQERCAFSYKYNISTQCIASNHDTSISLTYDNGTTPPVLFNNIQYNVYQIDIVTPSYHDFNGTQSEAEMIITHTSTDTASPLYVCIPISAQASNKNATFNEILQDVLSVPLIQKSTPVAVTSLSDYNISAWIPKRPYFFYVSQSMEANVVVFPIADGLYMDTDSLEGLSQLLQPITDSDFILPSENNYLFYNPSGPSPFQNGISDQIYIDCSPTGNSLETEDVVFEKGNTNTSNMDFLQYLTSNGVFLFLFFIGFIVLLLLINKFFMFMVKSQT